MSMRSGLLLTLALALGVGHARAAGPTAPPFPPERPVTETLYGQTVMDPYRYMEQLGPETLDWMKSEGRYARAIFDSMPGRAMLGRDLATYTASIAPARDYEAYGGRAFYELRALGSDNLALMARQPGGTVTTLVDVAGLRAAHGGAPYAIDYFEASPDGSKVAVGVSEGGSEDASVSVYDVTSGRQIAGPLDRAHFGGPSWTADSRGLFVTRLQPTGDQLARYANAAAWFWDLKSDPRPVVGANVAGTVLLRPEQFPRIELAPDSAWARAVIYDGSRNERELWLAPAADAANSGATWRKIASFDDDVTRIAQRGDDLYFVSHKDAPTFKVLHLRAGRPMSEADTLLAASPARLIEKIEVGSDAVYVEVREGLSSHLLRVGASGAAQDLPLPVNGSISEMFSDPRKPGVVIAIDGWTTPSTFFRYDPGTRRFVDLRLGPRPRFDPGRYRVEERQATAEDGVKVPLSYLETQGLAPPWDRGSLRLRGLRRLRVSVLLRSLDVLPATKRGGRHLPPAGWGRAWRGLAARGQGCAEVEHLARPDRLRRRPREEGRRKRQDAFHLRRLGRRRHSSAAPWKNGLTSSPASSTPCRWRTPCASSSRPTGRRTSRNSGRSRPRRDFTTSTPWTAISMSFPAPTTRPS